MDSVTTKLSGNLGERHRRFNALVHEAYSQNTSLPIQTHPEESAIDRLFKIDLASKQRNVDFIIHTLKDDDMLYVNRALKSRWLLEPEYSHIINPKFLEQELFPHMILPSVNKMIHWIQMHLREPQRCREMYQFYKERNLDVAAKFLWHCSNDYVLGEIFHVMDKITPKLLKRLSEKVPAITKIFYDNLSHNQTILEYYLENNFQFWNNIKYLLKTDANVFFHVLENFCVPQTFPTFNAVITKYIMKHHKDRFLCKPELYTAWFLDIRTLGRCLNSNEIQDLVLTLARAEYLQSWFSYQTVEPLIKCLTKEERSAFKNLVFVAKDFGPTVKEWPYPIPSSPELSTPQTNFFDDTQFWEVSCDSDMDFRAMLKKRKYAKWRSTTTLLDQLFEKYRFRNYKQTSLELQKQLKAESSSQNRQFMLLVLVSKTGGRTEDVISLLDLLLQYKNEPVHVRATIIRSLVKRAFIWRLPPEHWKRLLEWGHGLGLDGGTSEADCNEGLYAVVIRDLLADVKPSEVVWQKFLTSCFDDLHGYSLTADERRCVGARLALLLLETAQPKSDKPELDILRFLLDTLDAYHIKFDELPGVVEVIASVAKCREAVDLVRRLYNAVVARDRLIREYFEIIQTDASYVNALRHDISILDNTEKFEKILEENDLKHELFFRKIALYFTENEGLRERYRTILELRAATEPHKMLARPLAHLSGSTYSSLLKDFDTAPPKTGQRHLAAVLRSNAHIVRPGFDMESFGWRKAGPKAFGYRVAVCRQRDLERYLKQCLSWRRSLWLALMPAKRMNKERDVIKVLASKRPGSGLRAALLYFCREGDNSDPRIWELVKSRISKGVYRQLHFYMQLTDSVPAVIKAEYRFLVYLACKQNVPDMKDIALAEIPSVLPELGDKYVYEACNDFLTGYFTDPTNLKKSFLGDGHILLHIEIIAKFLLLSTSEQILDERFKKVGIPFLNRLEFFWKQTPNEVPLVQFLDTFLFYLRYNKVYFDVKYVSCLTVLQRVTEWIHTFLPIQQWFDKYVTVHLSMIYFKTARLCLKLKPELFTSSTNEALEMLGSIFGKIITNEIEDLSQKYFTSITKMYGKELTEYFKVYFYSQRSDEKVEKFTITVLRELLTSKSAASYVLAKYLFSQFYSRLNRESAKNIFNEFRLSVVEDLPFEIDF